MIKNLNLKEIKTIPNILSLFRIVLIIPFVIFFLNENYIAAAIAIILSGISDALDGFIARKFNQITDLGKMLDPLADKLTLIAIMICLVILFPIVMPVVIILIIKDVVMMIGASVLLKSDIKPPAARWYGKIGTIMFYFSVALIVFLKAVFNYENPILSLVLLGLTAAMMIFALIEYFLIFRKLKNSANTVEKE
ncbi:MAG: CDP-alcohol phosphatidyltransferase family protein [Ruminococcus sp.]|nr:CDP-alcohol phosphatidyltransferase family protein [Ruminococcus sp.]